jgi:hypothetical protein
MHFHYSLAREMEAVSKPETEITTLNTADTDADSSH